MPVIYAVLFIVAALIYLAYFTCALPIAAISAFVIYGLGMPVAYVVGLAQVLAVRPAGLPSPGRRLKLPADADPAVPQYFYGPAVVDADHAVRVAYDNCRKLWQQGARAVLVASSTDTVLLTCPLGIGGAIGMAAGTAVGAVVTAGCAIVHLLTVGVIHGQARGLLAKR